MKISHRCNPNRVNKTKTGAVVIYNCIVAFIAKETWPPSISELVQMSNYSRGSVVRYLDWLDAYGWIERGTNHEPRTIRVANRENKL